MRMQTNNKIHIIKECQLLEQELSKFKLWGNLIPKNSFVVRQKSIWKLTKFGNIIMNIPFRNCMILMLYADCVI